MESILLDLDDTFFNARHVLADAIEAEHGLKSDPDTWTTYRFSEIYNLPEDQVINAWIKHDVFSKMNLTQGALRLFGYCRARGIHIEFVTMRGFDPDAHARTIARLQEVLYFTPDEGNYSVTVTKWGENKHDKFKSRNPILFCDDSHTAVRDMQRAYPNMFCCLMAHPHNRQYRIAVPNHSDEIAYIDGVGVRAVKSMYDVLDALQFLRGQLITQRILQPTPSGIF